MRCARIILHEIFKTQLSQTFPAHPLFGEAACAEKFQGSINTILKMRDEIFYSVPLHLGYVNRKPFQKPEQDDLGVPFADLSISCGNFGIDSPDVPFIRDRAWPAIGGYYLLWPVRKSVHLPDFSSC